MSEFVGPNPFVKHDETQPRTFVDVVQGAGSSALEHLFVQPLGRLMSAAGAMLHLS